MSRIVANQAADVGPPHVAAQAAASWAAMDAAGRSDALADALREMQAVRDSVGSPNRILGSDAAKHGEMAEQVNVGIRRATDVLFGRAPSATFEGTRQFAPADIQSRYYNGLRNTLSGVLGPIRDRENSLRQAAGPSWAGFGKATGLGAVTGGGVTLAQMLWFKHREGKSPFGGQFSARDWSEVGVASAHGAVSGAVACGALYGITNSTALSAPAAGAVVSGLIGVGALLRQYGAGRIDGDEFLDGFSPGLYVSTLMKVAHSDGIHPSEREMLERQAAALGVDPDGLPDAPNDLSSLPWATRILVYRDALILAMADGQSSDAEQPHLAALSERLALPPDVVGEVSAWVKDYEMLLDRMDALLEESRPSSNSP